MANRKSINFLPQYFRTEINEKFLNATLDQWISTGRFDVLDGFVGRKDIPNFSIDDSYLSEVDRDAENYQLEPTITIRNQNNNEYKFASTYLDIINGIGRRGGNKSNHNNLCENEYYVWSPNIDYDKFINYTKYFWVPEGPEVLEITDNIKDIDVTIQGQKTYTTTSDLIFTSGLKIKFTGNVTPISYKDKEFFVEGVGKAIILVPAEEIVISSEKDYIVMGRGCVDGNRWSTGNGWFHEDVLNYAAERGDSMLSLNSEYRGKRPIIEFNRDLTLHNFGQRNIGSIDLIDGRFFDVFSQVERSTRELSVDDTTLEDGQNVMFIGDSDPLVYGNVYTVNIETIEDTRYINLRKNESFGNYQNGDVIVVRMGNTGKNTHWRYEDGEWIRSQTKTRRNQPPLFDLFDSSGISFSKYPGSNFSGSTVFEYRVSDSLFRDNELGFGLTYRNFENIGDIVFVDDINTGSFTHDNGTTNFVNGFLHINQHDSYEVIHNWTTAPGPSRQFLQKNIVIQDERRIFNLGVLPLEEDETKRRNIKVYVNGNLNDDYILSDNSIEFDYDLTLNDNLIIKVFAGISTTNDDDTFYESPSNLNNNPLNEITGVYTLGQIRNHIQSCAENFSEFSGELLGSNNIRDIPDISAYGTEIIQNSASLAKAGYFLKNRDFCFFRSLEYNDSAYSIFKKQLIKTAESMEFMEDTREWLDIILTTIFQNKSNNDPYFDSDMVPYGSERNTYEFVVIDINNKDVIFDNSFNDEIPENNGVLIYHNDELLIRNRDYYFVPDMSKAVLKIELEIGDKIGIVEFGSTLNNFVPTTPTKLGLWQSTIPDIYEDNTYLIPTMVMQCHDGSIIPLYNDYRDDILFEFEKRVYNNLKVVYDPDRVNVAEVIPGKFNDTGYDINSILLSEFIKWVSENNVDYSINDYYEPQNSFSWNMHGIYENIGDESQKLQTGYWRGIYKYFYGTDRPHTHPWEMFGFSDKPEWWETTYGPGPWTSDNLILWKNVQNGVIPEGNRKETYGIYARKNIVPGNSAAGYIPVDSNGNLRNPREIGFVSESLSIGNKSFLFGDHGPAETAWRRSSHFPFAMQKVMALSKPAKYFELMFDVSALDRNILGQIIDKSTGVFRRPVFEYEEKPMAGYINMIVDFIRFSGGPSVNELFYDLSNINLNLAYNLGGFSDKSKLNIILEQVSPSRDTNDIYISTDDYSFYLNNSSYGDKIVYSGIIIQRTANGYRINGYNKATPYFLIYPGQSTQNKRVVSVGGSSVNFTDYENGMTYDKDSIIRIRTEYYKVLETFQSGEVDNEKFLQKLPALPKKGGVDVTHYEDFSRNPIRINYGHEFYTIQQVYDFIIGYGRYLENNGFVFDNITDEYKNIENWNTIAKEYLFWTLNRFAIGSMITLSAGANKIRVDFENAQAAPIICNYVPSVVLNQNYEIIESPDLFYNRIDNSFELSVSPDVDGIYATEIEPTQTQHLIILENRTVFNDIIWDQFNGSRQNRIKLVGKKTQSWDGTLQLPGYVLLNNSVDEWNNAKFYNVGAVIKFKNRFYSALVPHGIDDLVNPEQFDYTKWREISNIRGGIIDNFDSKAEQFRSFYEIEEDGRITNLSQHSLDLIGFQRRKYMDNLQINPTTQAKFYQGFIKEKGTSSVINRLLRAELPSVDGDINFYEEWAFRVGDYGSTDSKQIIEFHLNEDSYSENPELIEIIDRAEPYKGGHITYRDSDLWKVPDNGGSVFEKNIFRTRQDNGETRFSLPTAGYVAPHEVDYIIYEMDNWLSHDYVEIEEEINVESSIIGKQNYITASGISLYNGMVLNFTSSEDKYKDTLFVVDGVGDSIKLFEKQSYLNDFNDGDNIWVANSNIMTNFRDSSNNWNVLRVSIESLLLPIGIIRNEANTIVNFSNDIDVNDNDYVILRNLINSNTDINYSSAYKVISKPTATSIEISAYYEELSNMESEPVTGEVLLLKNARFENFNSMIDTYNSSDISLNDTNKVWIDNYQDDKWAVLTKREPYELSETIYYENENNMGFGRSIISNKNSSSILVGLNKGGIIEQWNRDVPFIFDLNSIFHGEDITTNGVLSRYGHLFTINSDGLPYHASSEKFQIFRQNFEHTIKLNVGTDTRTSHNTVIPPNTMIGMAANGVPIYTPSYYDGNSDDPWNIVETNNNLDNFGGFPGESGDYRYYSNKFINEWNFSVSTGNTYYGDSSFNNNYYRHKDGHSKIIGYSFDGYPIYGPYGYIDSNDELSGTERMISSYKLFSTPREGRKYGYNTYKAGSYVSDYYYSRGSGTLDEHNGRYCVTPEYPNGTYAYFLTIDENNIPVYPYVIGKSFRETPVLLGDEIPNETANINKNTISLPITEEYQYHNTLVDVNDSSLNTTDKIQSFSSSNERKYVVYGMPFFNNNSGLVFVFEEVDGIYKTVDIIYPPILGGKFGNSCSIDNNGDYIVVGAPEANNTFVYRRVDIDNDSYTFQTDGTTRDYNIELEYSDAREIKVSINGQIVIRDVNYTINGQRIIFVNTPDHDSTIVIEKTKYWNTISGLSIANTGFGNSVSITNNADTIFIGMPLADAVSIWNRDIDNNFRNIQIIYGNSEFGYGVDTYLDGHMFCVGALGELITYHDTAKVNGIIEGGREFVSIRSGSTINIDNTEIVLSNTGNSIRLSLDDIVQSINNANIPFVGASVINGRIRIESNSIEKNNRLKIRVGSVDGLAVFESLGINLFNKSSSVSNNEYTTIGRDFKFSDSGKELLVSDANNDLRYRTLFDDGRTLFDLRQTEFSSTVTNNGAALLYSVNNDLSLSLAQDFTELVGFDNYYGCGFDLTNDYIFVGAPGVEIDDTGIMDSGAVYIFHNENKIPLWEATRQQEEIVDIDLINNAFVYNRISGNYLYSVDYIDPISGKIPGIADQEISYKTLYDPAVYNTPTSQNVTVNEQSAWGPGQTGMLWWDLSNMKYIEYRHGSLEYKKQNWGKLFPGTQITVYEWVESDILPSQYIDNGGSGTPKFTDDSVYSVFTRFDSSTNTQRNVYYYWVGNKQTMPEISTTFANENNNIRFASRGNVLNLKGTVPAATRKIPADTVATILTNPKLYGLRYIGIPAPNAIVGFNLQNDLVDDHVILSINYDKVKNDIILHSEWQLVQEGNEKSTPNDYLLEKMSDSLAGINEYGNPVPEQNIHISRKYGILSNPRQTMFVDRMAAVKVLTQYCNTIFSIHQIALEKKISILKSEEAIPEDYDELVSVYEELAYIDTEQLTDDYRVVVRNDKTKNNKWVLYTWNSQFQSWDIEREQKYKTSMYWKYVDWYAEGYDENITFNYVTADLNSINAEEGDIIRVDNNDSWTLYIYENEQYTVIGREDATISFDDILFESNEPLIEIRYIVDALKHEIFIDDLATEFNNLWFKLIKYVMQEQIRTDWIFKTSFISVNQNVRELKQDLNYIYNVEENIRDYINEAKPYRTNVRDYIFTYNANEQINADLTELNKNINSIIKFDRISCDTEFTAYDRFEPNQGPDFINETDDKNYLDRITLYYPGGQNGLRSNLNWKGEFIDTEYTYNAVLEQYGCDYKGNIIQGGLFRGDRSFDSIGFDVFFDTSNDDLRVLDTLLSGGDFSDTRGIEQGEIDIEGGKFISVESAYSPEELIPGITYDSLDMSVYELPYTDINLINDETQTIPFDNLRGFDGTNFDGFQQTVTINEVTGSSISVNRIVFDDNDSTIPLELPFSENGIRVLEDGRLRVGDISGDYSIDYPNNQITTSSSTRDATNNVIELVNFAGNNVVVYKSIYTGDGSKTTYKINIPLYMATQVHASVNGVPVDATIQHIDNDSRNIEVVFGSAPANDSRIVIHILNASPIIITNPGRGYRSQPRVIIRGNNTAPATAHALIDSNGSVYSIFVTDPGEGYTSAIIDIVGECDENASASAVVTDGKISQPDQSINIHAPEPINSIPDEGYDISGLNLGNIISGNALIAYITHMDGSVEFASRLIPPTILQFSLTGDINSVYSIGSSRSKDQLFVYTGNTLLSDDGYDIVDNAGTVANSGNGIRLASIPDTISATISIVINDGEYWILNNKLIIGPYTISDTQKLLVHSYSNSQWINSSTTKYNVALSGGTFTIDIPTENRNFWIWHRKTDRTKGRQLNDQLTSPQYTIGDNSIVINSSPENLANGDTIIVTSFLKNNQNPGFGWRRWENMLDEVQYNIIGTEYITELSQDLNVDDTNIHVLDASRLSVPDPSKNIPGVIFIDGERIEYYDINTTTNTLSRLRRATYGTGIKQHSIGEKVYDSGKNSLIKNANDNAWYDVNSGLTDGRGLARQNTPIANTLKNSPLR